MLTLKHAGVWWKHPKWRALAVSGCLLVLFAVLYVLVHNKSVPVLQPAGTVAAKERTLMYFAAGLSLFVVVPVFVLTAFIGITYRATNKKAVYQPEWDQNSRLEALWWCIPLSLIFVLSIVTWRSSHELDPYKALEHSGQPVTVQVIALDWKWLFIYPDENVASVNSLHVPINRPINFQITSNGAMNSFWIPQLGGQVYAMSGMSTKLHLLAEKEGVYRGGSANISGDGFADMHFETVASNEDVYQNWLRTARDGALTLNTEEMERLERPSKEAPQAFYANVSGSPFQETIDKFMTYKVSDGEHTKAEGAHE